MSEFEHGQLSPWGYIIDCETLPDLITTTDFSNFTNGRFGTTDTRISSSIPSASAGIRNYCGWHISPSLDCGMIYNVRDLRDAFVGGDLLVQLPATFVTDVKKVVLNAKWNEDAGDWDGDIIEDSDRFDFGMGDGTPVRSPTLPQPAPSRARTLEAGQGVGRLAPARAASRPGLCVLRQKTGCCQNRFSRQRRTGGQKSV